MRNIISERCELVKLCHNYCSGPDFWDTLYRPKARYTLATKSNSPRSILSNSTKSADCRKDVRHLGDILATIFTRFRQSWPSWTCSSLATLSTATSCQIRLCCMDGQQSRNNFTSDYWKDHYVGLIVAQQSRTSRWRSTFDKRATSATKSKVDKVESRQSQSRQSQSRQSQKSTKSKSTKSNSTLSTFDFVHRVEFDYVASVTYRP